MISVGLDASIRAKCRDAPRCPFEVAKDVDDTSLLAPWSMGLQALSQRANKFVRIPMRTEWKVILSVGAILLVAGGIYEVAYGAIYQGTYFIQNGFGSTGPGDASSGYTDRTVTFQNYPVWSPPSFDNVNYSSNSCTITEATYTPQNPSPSCLFPPASMAADYTKNYGGAILIILGALAGVAVVVSRERKLDTTIPDDAPSTAS